jgi:hypothetical protein
VVNISTEQATTVRAFSIPSRPCASTLTCKITFTGLYHSRTVCQYTARFDQAAPVGNSTISFSHDAWQHQIQSRLDACGQITSHEITIPKDLIGCKLGVKVLKSVRSVRGLAQIKIANPLEGSDRKVSITGSAATISLAQYLIDARLSLEMGGMGHS